MADKQESDHAAVRVFPPGVPLATVLAGAGLSYLWPIDLGFAVPAPARHWIGGAIVAGAFLGLGLWSVVIFRRTGQNENPLEAVAPAGCARAFPRDPQSDVSPDGAGLHRHRRDHQERMDPALDAALRVGASQIRNPAGGNLSRAQIRRGIPRIQAARPPLALARPTAAWPDGRAAVRCFRQTGNSGTEVFAG